MQFRFIIGCISLIFVVACNASQVDGEFRPNVWGVMKSKVLVDNKHKVSVERIPKDVGQANLYSALYVGTGVPITQLKAVGVRAIEQAGNCKVDPETIVLEGVVYAECN